MPLHFIVMRHINPGDSGRVSMLAPGAWRNKTVVKTLIQTRSEARSYRHFSHDSGTPSDVFPEHAQIAQHPFFEGAEVTTFGFKKRCQILVPSGIGYRQFQHRRCASAGTVIAIVGRIHSTTRGVN